MGVATKNRFRQTKHSLEVLRPGSKRPLYAIAIGMDSDVAGLRIQSMPGEFRIPEML
jgi:hypothetical protein